MGLIPPAVSGDDADALATAPRPARLSPDQHHICVRYPADGAPDIVVTGSGPSGLRSTGMVQLPMGSGALFAARSDTGPSTAGKASTNSPPSGPANQPNVADSTTIADSASNAEGESGDCGTAPGSSAPGLIAGGPNNPGDRKPASGAGSANGDGSALVCLVTDTGVRYPLAGPRALQQLGLGDVSVARLPAAVIRLLQLGPVLDPATAGAVANP